MATKEKSSAKEFKVVFSQTALSNIDEITGYIALIQKAPETAIKIGDAIFETIERIQHHPHAFRECEELSTKSRMYRRALCKSWLIIFKVQPALITILGIIHTSRKPAGIRKLRKSE